MKSKIVSVSGWIVVGIFCFGIAAWPDHDDNADRIKEAVCAEQQHLTALKAQWHIERIIAANRTGPDSLRAEMQAAYNKYVANLKTDARLKYYQIDHPDSDTIPSIYE